MNKMNLDHIISNAKTIAICGHMRPDGDCVGSCLALWNYIKRIDKVKQVIVYLEEIPEKFSFLNGSSEIRSHNDNIIYDVCFSLDCGSPDRLGFAEEIFLNAKRGCCIDHHVSNQATGEDYYVVPTASSTCELLFELMTEENLNREIAECLYLGLAHDTGVFQYSNTSPTTMRMAAKLLELGVQGSRIVEDTYYEKTIAQNRALGKALVESELYLDGICLAFSLSINEMNELGVVKQDLDPIVSQLRTTKGVEIAVFMYQLDEEEYKVSLRASDKIDASTIATYFGGGGHKKAAGFSLYGDRDKMLPLILEQIQLQQ